MRFDLNLRTTVKQQLQEVAHQMQSWQGQNLIDDREISLIKENLQFFEHQTSRTNLKVAGVDGSGDFPMLSYADSFVYLSVAQATIYQSDPVHGLKELAPTPETIINVGWIPENRHEGYAALDKVHEQIAGRSLLEVIEQSDYRQLKAQETKKSFTPESLLKGLIRPHASDVGNLAIQLRTTAEMSAALSAIASKNCPDYILMDTTYSLPLLASRTSSLFFEHLKRLCCVEARKKGVGFFTLSKSHGLPSMELLEKLAKEIRGLEDGKVAEHWYLRIPEQSQDGWQLTLAEGRRIPPPGAVSYLVRFRSSTPVLRIDMDREYWNKYVKSEDKTETLVRESQIFADLDYTCRDQRVYGYPYPIKAAHDRASLTDAERVALRKQLIAEAVKEGMSPKLFRDVSQATGHR